MTQNEMVLDHLQRIGSITTYDAYRKGITRLSARIWELKHRYGVQIEKERIDYKARDGKRKHYDKYKLGEK